MPKSTRYSRLDNEGKRQVYEDDVWGALCKKYKVDPKRAESLIKKENLVVDTGFLTKEKPRIVAQWIALNNGILRFKT